MTRRQPNTEVDQDDATNIAGWVFADLLLGLSVIFLVSISFALPSDSGTPVNILGSAPTALQIDSGENRQQSAINEGYNFYYTKFDKDQIEEDLKNYFGRQNIPLNSDVLYAQIVGGFDPKTEGSEVGTIRALEFSIAIKNSDIKAFQRSNYDLTTSSEISAGSVALRLSFAPPLLK